MSAQSQQLDDHLHSENHGEDHVEDVHDGGEELGLLVMLEEGETRALSNGPPSPDGERVARRYLHGQRERVSQDQHKHDVFELAGVDDLPEFELGLVFRDVNLNGLSFEGVVDALALERTDGSR